MIWVLVCINMCRYERHFGSIHRNPTILETVSISSQWVNTELTERLFLLNYNDREYLVRMLKKVSTLHLSKMRVLKYYVKMKHYLRHENKGNENKVLSYCKALR